MIDQIIEYNKTFVAQKGYEKYLTDKYPVLYGHQTDRTAACSPWSEEW